jgi:UDP-glucose 4-epimerase
LSNVLFLGYGPIVKNFLKYLPDTSDSQIHIVSDQIDESFNGYSRIFSNYNEISKIRDYDFRTIVVSWKKLDQRKIAIIKELKGSRLKNALAINLSSCSVYGPGLMKRADVSGLQPINQYGRDKLEIENFLDYFSFRNSVTLRIANLYGLLEFRDITNNIVESIRSGSPLTLSNYGNSTRDFVHIDDLYKGLQALVNREYPFTFLSNKTVLDFASGKSTSINDLVELVESSAIRKVTSRMYSDSTHSEIQISSQDPTQMIDFFGFLPTEIEIGISRYVKSMEL